MAGDLAAKHAPDLALVDVEMPVLNGPDMVYGLFLRNQRVGSDWLYKPYIEDGRAPGLFPPCAASSLSGGYQKQHF